MARVKRRQWVANLVERVARLLACENAEHQEDDEQDDGDDRQPDRDIDEGTGNAAKAKDRGSSGDDETDESQFDHAD